MILIDQLVARARVFGRRLPNTLCALAFSHLDAVILHVVALFPRTTACCGRRRRVRVHEVHRCNAHLHAAESGGREDEEHAELRSAFGHSIDVLD